MGGRSAPGREASAADNPATVRSSASSHVAGRSSPPFVSRTRGWVRRTYDFGNVNSCLRWAPPFGGAQRRHEFTLPKSYVRLTQPLVRDTKGGELRPATWDEALDRTVAGLSAALASRPGAERPPIGIFSCSKATNEVNYAAQKFSRQVLGSNN